MYISKPLRWKHLELSEKKIKHQQEYKCQKYDLLGQVITLFTQFRSDFFLIFYEAKARFFFQLWVARLFILFTRGTIWGNRNRTKKSQNLKSSSELTYRMYKLCKLLLVCAFQNHYDENIWSCRKNMHDIISLQGKKCKKFNFFQNQNDTCARLFTLVMKFHDRQSSERCIRKLIALSWQNTYEMEWELSIFSSPFIFIFFLFKVIWNEFLVK
jgi:hypothetical protein